MRTESLRAKAPEGQRTSREAVAGETPLRSGNHEPGLYMQLPRPTPTTRAPQHLHELHNKARTILTMAKKDREDKRLHSKVRPSPLPQEPHQEHEHSPDRRIRERMTPEAPRLCHRWRRRDGEEALATLFHNATATTILAATPGSPTLLSTCLRHRSEVPPLSRRRSDNRRGRGLVIRPSAEQGNSAPPLFASLAYCSQEKGTG